MPTRKLTGFVSVLLSVCALVSGCATGGSRGVPVKGVESNVAWEIVNLRQRVDPAGRAVRWYYTLVLTETAGRAIDFETQERSAQGHLRYETAETFPFKRSLAANGELRLNTWDGISMNPASSGGFGQMREGQMTVFRRFVGKDQAGHRVTVSARLDLDRRVGTPVPEPAVIELPAQTSLNQADIRTLAGTWVGYYRDSAPFAIPLQLTISEDGAFEGAVDEPVTSRFRGNLTVRDGRLAYSRGPDTGTLTLYGQGDRRVLDGTITGTREGQQAGTTQPVSFAFRVATLSSPPPGTTVLGPASTSALPQPPPPPPPSTTSPVSSSGPQADKLTNDGVLAMVKAGIDESVILLKIKTAPPAFDVGADALVQLKRAGVSERILEAMIARGSTKP